MLPWQSTPIAQIHCLVAHQALVADLHPQRVEIDHRIHRLQRPVLPVGDFLQNRVRDRGDQRRGNLDAIRGSCKTAF